MAILNDVLYVIGGWSGQSGLADCESYNPKNPEEKWKPIARLGTGMDHKNKIYKSVLIDYT